MAQIIIPDPSINRRRTRTYDAIDRDNLRETLQAIVDSLTPAGTIIPTISETDPGLAWRHLNGQALEKAAFTRLYAIFGETYGATETTFNLPDWRGRILIGAGGDTDVALQALAGSAEITLTVAQMPTHSHAITDPGHNHSFTADPHSHEFTGSPHSHTATEVDPETVAEGTDAGSAIEGSTSEETAEGSISEATIDGSISPETTGISIGDTGGGEPINILPPVVGVHWLVKT